MLIVTFLERFKSTDEPIDDSIDILLVVGHLLRKLWNVHELLDDPFGHLRGVLSMWDHAATAFTTTHERVCSASTFPADENGLGRRLRICAADTFAHTHIIIADEFLSNIVGGSIQIISLEEIRKYHLPISIFGRKGCTLKTSTTDRMKVSERMAISSAIQQIAVSTSTAISRSFYLSEVATLY